jgi:hypothetical protein
VKEKEQQQEHEFNSADWASDSDDDGLLDDEAMEGDTDDSNLSDSEIERQKERIRSMRGDLFVRILLRYLPCCLLSSTHTASLE